MAHRRQPTARTQAATIFKLVAAGKSKVGIAKELGIGVASVYRVLSERKKAAA